MNLRRELNMRRELYAPQLWLHKHDIVNSTGGIVTEWKTFVKIFYRASGVRRQDTVASWRGECYRPVARGTNAAARCLASAI